MSDLEKKMEYKYFGDFLKDLRSSRKMTQVELAEDICSVRQLNRIENNTSEPSLYLLHKLSIKFNIDLQEFYKIHFNNQSFEAYKTIEKLNEVLTVPKLSELSDVINTMENRNEFKTGENFQHLCYAKALYSTVLENDYKRSTEYCIEGIKVEDSKFSMNQLTNKVYSNVGLSMLNCIGCNYNSSNDMEKAVQIFESIISIIEERMFEAPLCLYRSNEYDKKLYQNVTCNLSICYQNLNSDEQALFFVNKGIKFSVKSNYTRFLPDLLGQKAELEYRFGNRKVAKESYRRCIYIYELFERERDLGIFKERIKGLYSDIDNLE